MKKFLVLFLIVSGIANAETQISDLLVLENGDTIYAELTYNWSEDLVSFREGNHSRVYTPRQVRYFTINDSQSDFCRLFVSEQDRVLGHIFSEVIISGNICVSRKQRSEASIAELRHYSYYQQSEIPPRYQYIVRYDGEKYITYHLSKLLKRLLGNQYSTLRGEANKIKLPYSSILQNMMIVYLFNNQDGNTDQFIADMQVRL